MRFTLFQKNIFASLVFLVVLSTTQVKAQQLSTNILINACNEAENGACIGYIQGTIDGLRWASSYAAFKSGARESQKIVALENSILDACIPRSLIGSQLQETALKYMRNNPERWHEPPYTVIHTALIDAFPCR